MQQAINEILNDIPGGRVFDSHYVISQLLKKHSDAYLIFASGITASSGKTLAVHGQIGKEIAKFEPRLITKLQNLSWSENIHGSPSECAGWSKN